MVLEATAYILKRSPGLVCLMVK